MVKLLFEPCVLSRHSKCNRWFVWGGQNLQGECLSGSDLMLFLCQMIASTSQHIKRRTEDSDMRYVPAQLLHQCSNIHMCLCARLGFHLYAHYKLCFRTWQSCNCFFFGVTHCQGRGRRQSVWLHMVWRRLRRAGTAHNTLRWLYTGLTNNPPYWPELQPANHQRDHSKWDQQSKIYIQQHPKD